MKTSKLIRTIIGLTFVMLGLFVFSACDHAHEPAADYLADENYHWHECTHDDCTEKVDVEKHTLGDYVSDNMYHYKICTVCGKEVEKQSHSIKNTICEVCGYHKHTNSYVFAADASGHWYKCVGADCDYKFNETPHTAGEYQTDETYHYKNCTVCNYELEKQEHTVEDFACTVCKNHVHEFDSAYTCDNNKHYRACKDSHCNGKTDEGLHEPSAWLMDGNYHYKICVVCKREIAREEHNIVNCNCTECGKHMHEFESNYTYDGSSHYKACKDPNCTYRLDVGNHTASEWLNDGAMHHKVCTVCGYELAREAHEIENCNCTKCGKHEHDYEETFTSNALAHWRKCKDETCNSYIDEVAHTAGTFVDEGETHAQYCTVCGYELVREAHEIANCNCTKCGKHEHDFDENYTSDDDCHWQACKDPNCSARKNYTSHKLGEMQYNKSFHYQNCTVCNRSLNVEYHNLENTYCKCGYHEHSPSGKYANNETHHWHDCAGANCDYKYDLDVHEWGAYQTDANYHYRICNVCGYQSPKEEHKFVDGANCECGFHQHNYDSNGTCSCGDKQPENPTSGVEALTKAIPMAEVSDDTYLFNANLQAGTYTIGASGDIDIQGADWLLISVTNLATGEVVCEADLNIGDSFEIIADGKYEVLIIFAIEGEYPSEATITFRAK